ncbi:hypothetical protein C4K10_1890 [Pseudomonas chlororaphis subsp. aureofaciens]|uniref:HI1506-related protein n=1 Tax=Pseudomonas chlororaphis TaxID=587753 RepID=UPI000F57DC75|nr:HI1506-related protein [Pseudomonas chlororaphis]AZE10180.1 hypothetical protein C4K10_1890 [Pseudomonas chlororaphis subsp. aureofaciens]
MAIVITIKSRRNGFRRCGVAHSDQPTDYHLDDFTDEQWEALDKEPQLILTVKETDLEQRHELTPDASVSLPETPNTPQAAQPQTLEASAEPVGSAVDEICRQILGNEQPGADDLASDGPDQVARDGQDPDLAQTSADASGAADQVAEQSQDAAETPAKPVKTRTAKPKGDAE